MDTLLDRDGIDRLRAALSAAGYTAGAIAARLGPAATAAAARNDVRLALRATEDRDRLGTLIRMFVCGQVEPEAAVAAALDPLPLADARAAGLVEPYADGLRQGVDLETYGAEWWVLADVPAAAGGRARRARGGARRGGGPDRRVPRRAGHHRAGERVRPPVAG